MTLKQFLSSATLVIAGISAPQFAAAVDATLLPGIDLSVSSEVATDDGGTFDVARRGRGRGGDDDRSRGRHRSTDDQKKGGKSGSGRSKPRIPGGSGCDDPGDIREHAECRI